MGTPAITLPVFEALINDRHFEIVGAYTQPDRPVGRHSEPMPTPVKVHAQKYDIPVYQPERIDENTISQLRLISPDLVVVFAYSEILPKEILSISKYGFVNIHPSLLPRHRGPAPIVSAILSGDEVTGVSYMLMDEKIDHGPIIKQIEYNIDSNVTAGALTQELALLAAKNVSDVLLKYIEGKLTPREQNHNEATYSPFLKRVDARLDWNQSAETIMRQIRALNPWPGTYFTWKGKKIKVTKAELGPDEDIISPGKTAGDLVGCGNGSIRLIEVQMEGKRPALIKEFLNGHKEFYKTSLD